VKIELVEIPSVRPEEQSRWKVRALSLDGHSPALVALHEWQKKEFADFKKIMKVMRMVGGMHRVPDQNKVKRCENPAYGEIYEMRAHKGHARLMFFYSEREDAAVVVCTNDYWKEKGSQDAAFARCAKLKQIYESHDEHRSTA
jgi:hypothetical protein